MNSSKRQGFTLVEMLVVMGIIAVLVAASVVGYSRVTASAEKAKCNELVKNVHTAMMAIYNENNGAWPRALINGQQRAVLDENAALPLAKYLGLRTENGRLVGYDKFGILSPWATQVIKAKGNSADLGTKVPSGGTIDTHRLGYAIDTEGTGKILNAQVGSGTLKVRATAMVWCGGKDGFVEDDFARGLRKDDVYSWRVGDLLYE